ncbi:Rhomboid family protein [compost metagenome]
MNPPVQSWKVVHATWLTRKPSAQAWMWATWSVLFLILGSAMYWHNLWSAADWMPASQITVFEKGQWWRLWTTLFAHGDLGHLLSNSFLFFIFGYFLSGYFGAFVFPLAALALGGLTNAFVLLTYEPHIRLIGVSGVVYWMGGVWLVLYFLLDQQRTHFQRTLRALGVALGVFMPSTAFDPQVSYQAHLVGFILGLAFGGIYYGIHRSKFQKALVYEIVTEEASPLESSDSSLHDEIVN